MKYLSIALLIAAIYFVFCAFSAIINLSPFSAFFELIVAGILAYFSKKVYNE